MPSKRPSPNAMDEAGAAPAPAARLRPSTPRSKKRSSRSKSRARSRDRRRSPNPNPSSRRERPPEQPGSAAPAPSRKSDRKPRPRYIPDSATLATALSATAAAAAAPSSGGGGRGGGGRGSAGAITKLWTEADEVALLTGAAAFKGRTGFAPRAPDMPELFDSIRDSLSSYLDQDRTYYKLKRLKSKFQHSVPGDSSTAHELRVRDLCAALWGGEPARPVENDVEEAEEAEEGDADGGFTGGDREGSARLPMVKEVLGEYWKLNGQGLSGVSLEKGLSLLGSHEASVAEGKWRQQLEADMRIQMRRHELGKEVYGLLIDAIKGLGP
ncbi:unnamed protein product [Urochloa humidicola]